MTVHHVALACSSLHGSVAMGRPQEIVPSSSVAIRQFVSRVKPSSFNGTLLIGRGPA